MKEDGSDRDEMPLHSILLEGDEMAIKCRETGRQMRVIVKVHQSKKRLPRTSLWKNEGNETKQKTRETIHSKHMTDEERKRKRGGEKRKI